MSTLIWINILFNKCNEVFDWQGTKTTAYFEPYNKNKFYN